MKRQRKRRQTQHVRGRLALFVWLSFGTIAGAYRMMTWTGAGIGLGVSAIGATLFLFGLTQYRLKAARHVDLKKVDAMTGEQFEHYLANLFKSLRYKVERTPTSGDYGADLILKESSGYRIIIQAKRYQSKVGLQAVQEVAAAIKMYDADEAWVVTNSTYTAQAKKLAAANDITLIDRNGLRTFIQKANHSSFRRRSK